MVPASPSSPETANEVLQGVVSSLTDIAAASDEFLGITTTPGGRHGTSDDAPRKSVPNLMTEWCALDESAHRDDDLSFPTRFASGMEG